VHSRGRHYNALVRGQPHGSMSSSEENRSHYSSVRSNANNSRRSHQSKNSSEGRGEAAAPLSVLLADDSAIARKMVERLLSSDDCVCHHAHNGVDAVAKVKQSMEGSQPGFDVVLMDCYMPEMNGPEAVRLIRGAECGYRGIVLAVTGASTDSEFNALLGQGVDRIFVKPFNLEDFRRAMTGE